LPNPGLYRVEIVSGGASAVSQLMLAGDDLTAEGSEVSGSS
jgi:hypothetical protein